MFCQDYFMIPYCGKEGGTSLYRAGLATFRGVWFIGWGSNLVLPGVHAVSNGGSDLGVSFEKGLFYGYMRRLSRFVLGVRGEAHLCGERLFSGFGVWVTAGVWPVKIRRATYQCPLAATRS